MCYSGIVQIPQASYSSYIMLGSTYTLGSTYDETGVTATFCFIINK